MEGRQLAFMSRHHPSDGALASIGYGGDGGGVALLSPSSPLREPDVAAMMANNLGMHSQLLNSADKSVTALNLSTYTAGEDAGRLAMLAKEFGLARMRHPKRQLRKHTFMAFLRNHPDNLNEDLPQQPLPSDIECKESDVSQSNEILRSTPAAILPKKHPPLRFVFSGYSLWLELEQKEIDNNGQGDLDRAMIDAADRFNLGGAIPSPHVTALYGIDTIADEEEMRRVFREDVKRVLLEEAEKRKRRRMEGKATDGDDDFAEKLWPDLAATGIIVGAEFDGVNGGTMDMAWSEISLKTSPEHETILNALYDIFYRRPGASAEPAPSSSSDEEKKEEYVPQSNPWVPHLSLCYDNPEGFGPNLSRFLIEKFLLEKCPTLVNVLSDDEGGIEFARAVSGISLWKTAGRMDEWKCLDRYEFPLGA